MRTPATRIRVLALVGVLLVLGLPNGASAADSKPREPAEIHCVLRVTDQAEDGRFITEDEGCFPTFEEAREQARQTPGVSARTGEAGGVAAMDSVVLATHYMGLNETGSSLTVIGSSCQAEGWMNMNSTWNNKIRSTISDCVVYHYDGFNTTGVWESLFPVGGNLTSMDKRTSSAFYTY